MKKTSLILLTAAALLAGTAFALPLPSSQTQTQMTQTSKPQEKGVIADIKTTAGDIKVLLYDDTPQHRDNFVKLAKEGYYDGVLFHRVIKDFMVQTGDPDSKNAQPGQRLGAGSPDYTIPAEIDYPKHYHKYGALAAARTGDQVNPERRSSGSQFYIVTGNKIPESQIKMMEQRMTMDKRQGEWRKLMMANKDTIMALQKAGDPDKLEAYRQELIAQLEKDVPEVTMPENVKKDYIEIGGTPHLDGQYTVFGEVLSGMDTVEKIQAAETSADDRPTEDIRVISVTIE